jgi:predicted ATPase with chaperone activity
MLARRLRGLLPDLDRDEALEVTQVLSAAGLVQPDAPLATARPFRAPITGSRWPAWSAAAPASPAPARSASRM